MSDYIVCFNSLQTGRSFRTFVPYPLLRDESVSIPFKREGLSEQGGENCWMVVHRRVSIPFKREGLSEHFTNFSCTCHSIFVSIPFKREGLSERTESCSYSMQRIEKFQFPSNGKVFPNNWRTSWTIRGHYLVSIPFKREGLSERGESRTDLEQEYWSFNSLQTGRSFRTTMTCTSTTLFTQFQFPSNGKVFPNFRPPKC